MRVLRKIGTFDIDTLFIRYENVINGSDRLSSHVMHVVDHHSASPLTRLLFVLDSIYLISFLAKVDSK